MKTTNTYKIILFIVVILIFLSCDKDVQDNYVAMVSDVPITEYEFTMRYNFNPYLSQIHSEKEAKKLILSTLIAEKLLSLESTNQLETSTDMNRRINQHKKEAMIEQFRQDSVENKINITDLELQKEYQKALKEVDIQYVAFSTLEKADMTKEEIDNGLTYEEAVRNYMDNQGWKDEAIPQKTVKWNSESYNLEEKIFALNSGEVSKPVNINGDYYLIKIEEIRTAQSPGNRDYMDRLPALKDRILKKKVEEKYRKFFSNHIAKRLGIVNWEKLDDIFESITKDVKFNQNTTQPHPFSDEKALSNEVYLNYETQQSQLKNIPVVNFPDGSVWQMNDLMTVLKYGPFAFNYKNKTAFKKSFKQSVLLALEFEAIYQLAQEAGYEQNNHVLADTKIWETYYRANDYRFQKLNQAVSEIYIQDSTHYISGSQMTAKQEFRLEYFDKYLCTLAGKYQIKINQKKYNTIKLDKTDIVLMKTHYAQRLIAPMTEPLSGLPQWSNIVDSIFKKSEII